MITKIGTVGVYVEDQMSALQFWTEKIGFVEKDRKDMGNGKFFMCDDIDAFCAGLKQKGVKFDKELMNLGWGKFASFLDEDGNKYGLKG